MPLWSTSLMRGPGACALRPSDSAPRMRASPVLMPDMSAQPARTASASEAASARRPRDMRGCSGRAGVVILRFSTGRDRLCVVEDATQKALQLHPFLFGEAGEVLVLHGRQGVRHLVGGS